MNEQAPARTASETNDDVAHWPIPRLIDFIVSTHHAYVRSAMPEIAQHLTTLTDVHGSRHPELSRVAAYFDQVRGDLEQHMLKEEQVLFPYVRDLAEAGDGCGRTQSPFGTVANPIRMMEREHQEVGDALRIIRELTQGTRRPRTAAPPTRSAWPSCSVSSATCTGTCTWRTTCCFPPPSRSSSGCAGAMEAEA